MSEFKETKSYEDLAIENKQMLEMLKECYKYLPYEGVMRKKIEQLIKQATEI